MAIKGAFSDKDRGAVALLKVSLEHPVIDVGIIGAKADRPRGRATVREIAGFNEFGTKGRGGHTPARPFVGSWFDLNRAEMSAFIEKAAKLLLENKLTSQQFVRLVGEKAAGGIKKHMASGIAPENAPSTIKRKKSSKTLVDKGIMRSSVSYREVKTGGGYK